jgi:hypothetical protein
MSGKIRKLGDKRVVVLFVEYLAHRLYPGLKIERFPDEEVSGDIDAIAGQFAIEHTSIDTIPQQSRDAAWFLESIGSLEQEFEGKLPFRLFLTLPYTGIQWGQDWQELRTALQKWVADESAMLPEGSHMISCIPGVPFDFRARKMHTGKAGVLLSRFAPDNSDFPSRLRSHLDRKIAKLAPYKGKGKTTLLLVESDDIAFMNEGVMWDSLRDAYPEGLPPGVDKVWFVHTSIPEDVLFFEMNEAFKR